jgi:hypothetical protein
MVQLPNVTIIGVAGTLAEQTLKAIEYSSRRIEFGAMKLITPDKLTSYGCEIIECEPLNYEQYNHFIVYRLHEYIDTEFALLVQNDGYVVNPDRWRDEFLEYDYIGAPWPYPTDNYSFRDPEGTIHRVGNGGFSLRSKKLLEVPKLYPSQLEWRDYYGNYHEDGFVCVHNRKVYENAGCKFAPIEVAAKFSHETNIPETYGTIPFGFHGRGSYYYQITKNKIWN